MTKPAEQEAKRPGSGLAEVRRNLDELIRRLEKEDGPLTAEWLRQGNAPGFYPAEEEST